MSRFARLSVLLAPLGATRLYASYYQLARAGPD
jgi:hypothetical protein